MIGNFLNKLDKVQGKRGHWIACCPAHEDKRPSLAITETDDGRILLKCFAGCSAYEVVSSVGMDLTDLFPKDQSFTPHNGNKPVKRPFYATDLMRVIHFEATIVQIVAFDISEGKKVSETDRQRVRLAYERITEAMSYANV